MPPRWGKAQYGLVLLAFCAMKLGCAFPSGFLQVLNANCVLTRGLLDEGKAQMRTGCAEYINGKPFDFLSIEFPDGYDTCSAQDYDQPLERPVPRAAGLEEVPIKELAGTDAASDGGKNLTNNADLFSPSIMKQDPGTQPEYRFAEDFLRFPPDRCANCGASEGYGPHAELRRCKACKDTLYCFEGCQKWHFFFHEDHCEGVRLAALERNFEREEREAEEVLRAAKVFKVYVEHHLKRKVEWSQEDVEAVETVASKKKKIAAEDTTGEADRTAA